MMVLSIIRLGVYDIPITVLPDETRPIDPHDNRPFVTRWANDAEYALYISFAQKIRADYAWGANAKIIHKNVDENSAWGIGFDLGFLYKPTENLNVGLDLQNATTTLIAWDNGTRETISPTLKIGGAYSISPRFLHGMLTPVLDVDLRYEGRKYASQFHWGDLSADFRCGVEYWFERLFALRMGCDDLGRFSAGTGFQLHHLSRNVGYASLDFAFLSKGDLQTTYRISASVGF
jgi:hypothetical protein